MATAILNSAFSCSVRFESLSPYLEILVLILPPFTCLATNLGISSVVTILHEGYLLETRTLVVDDYEPWRRFISSKLQERAEYRIIGEALDGIEAVHKAEALQPDLIVLDIGLPTLNGIDAARRIQELSPKSKILFLSENRSPDIVEGALRTGAKGYVLKSNAERDLLPAVEAVLQGKQFVSAGLAGHSLNGPRDDDAIEAPRFSEVIVPLPLEKIESKRCHEIAFYRDDAAFLDGSARFIESALKVGNTVIVVVTESHGTGLLQRLRADDVDVDAAITRGNYIPLDVDDTLSTFMVNDLPDPVRFMKVAGDLIEQAAKAAQGEHPRVAAFGESAPKLLARANAEATIRLEHLWDGIARSYDVDILCGYLWNASLREENTALFQRICGEHTVVHTR